MDNEKHSYYNCFQKDTIKDIRRSQEELESDVKSVRLDLQNVIKAQTENTISINKLTVTLEEKEKAEQQREADKIRREVEKEKKEEKKQEKLEKQKDRRLKKRMQYLGIIGTAITGMVIIFVELLARRLI